ncbi:MAG: ribonuclease HII [Nitrosopumilus sp. H13]|nr:MAG: ribonuclease HII [Nitrosopumilus sp. H13]
MSVCGIDDAGRGSMLGPLVIAGVSVRRSKLKRLASIGVRDSKKLTPASRERLYHEILSIADGHYIARIPPRSIDASVRRHGLNDLEARYMALVASKLDSDVSYVDSCDVNPRRFGKKISQMSGNRTIRSYHHADSRFAVVSAASILAKVERDKSIKRLKRRHDLGSGYPADPASVRFVTAYYAKNRSMPSFVRKSWRPILRITG